MTMAANEETIQLYMDAARRALAEARYNLAGEYWGVTAARAYYAYFYATCALLLTKDIIAGALTAGSSLHFGRTSSRLA